MGAILRPAARHRKSSRGTPRLRRLSGTLHGALRLAAPTTGLDSWLRPLTDTGRSSCVDLLLHYSRTDTPSRSELVHPVAASGGVLVLLDWLALTPALTEIRLFDRIVHFVRFVASSQHAAPNAICGLAASWLFNPRRQAHFLLEPPHGGFSDA